ncbi:type VII secretion-associated serine protease mycosin [Nocardia camponoti]|uniref:type VII secretion-associated serine protease mycosin n=1 Tax=Nocardia camponoti TaxID=1616106 RepID=UPI001E4A7B86|nr:type VII secretion-associated serine protease mycosin [Nocardia camponoti]
MTRFLLTTAIVGCSAGVGAPSAVAAGPPTIDGALTPGDAPPKPYTEVEPANACTSTRTTTSAATPPAQVFLGLDHAWQFSRGAGQTVAVIDTGVARHPRLPNLAGGGDYVASSDGTEDCDAHGTVVAGIIGAQPSSGDGFSGVAPDAQIIAIRQSSGNYRPKGTQVDPNDPKNGGGVGNTTSLAQAVRHAADMGATVINISEVACGSPTMNDRTLGAAVQYAATVKDAVIVASAGNSDNKACTGNPGINPLDPGADPWSSLATAVTPAWYDQYVLSVGSVDANGAPSAFTVPGPWVGVAAPGEGIVSLDPNSTGLATGTVGTNGEVQDIAGTSFAAPYVSGVAALVRARFPELSAAQVISRIQATTHNTPEGWNPYGGFGTVDPFAALTHDVDLSKTMVKRPSSAKGKSVQLAVPATPPSPDNTARNVALIGTGVIAFLTLLGVLASFPIRRAFAQRK